MYKFAVAWNNNLIMNIKNIRNIFILALLLILPLTGLSNGLSTESGSEQKPAIKPQKKPVFIEADRITGYYKKEIEAIGDAEIQHGDNILTAGRMKYYQLTEDTEAEGNVSLDRPKDILKGTNLQINLKTEEGHMSEPRYYIKDGKGRGAGSALLFEGKNNYRLQEASYTTCPEGNDDWYVRAKELEIDHKNEVGTARHASIVFKNTPILYSPWIDFSYSGKRKSGILTPILGYNVRTGFDTALPIYLNIAPNIDATIAPRIMTERGFMLSNEARYLGNHMNGRLLFDILPDDIKTNQTRWAILYEHTQNLGKGWQGLVNYNQVSDDRYFRDLNPNLAQTSLRNLAQQGEVLYNGRLGTGGVLSFRGLAQGFQVLQDPFAPYVPPYARLPHFSVNAIKQNVAGLDFELNSSWSNFYHPTLVDGNRLVMFPNVSAPLRNAYGYLTPKFGVHYTQYNLASPITETKGENMSRTVPIFSLDSGIAFDRQIGVGGSKFTQTLEPRVFYVYAPYSNQNLLPNFESALNDFSFTQIFNENRFSGNDRINDANRVALALTSRFVEQQTGIERLRLAAGQQIDFSENRVSLSSPQVTNPQQITSGKTDFIAAIAGRLTPRISTDTNIQIDQSRFSTERIRAGISYQPDIGKVLNFGYRFTRDVIEQVDTSVQWPIAGKLHGVARVNYSLKDDKILAGLAGFEYNSCCWALRVVMQRLTTATQTQTTAYFVQLELKGLMGLGNNPLQVLQQTIPGYTSIY